MGVGASEIAVESFAARETYQRVVLDALRSTSSTGPFASPPCPRRRAGGAAATRSPAARRCCKPLRRAPCGSRAICPHLSKLRWGWQQHQHQPDALAALVVAHEVLIHSLGQQVHIVSPLDVACRAREGTLPPPPAWMR